MIQNLKVYLTILRPRSRQLLRALCTKLEMDYFYGQSGITINRTYKTHSSPVNITAKHRKASERQTQSDFK